MILSNHLILCHPLLFLPSICPSIRVFSIESVLHIRWPKYWNSASASVLPMNIQGWFPSGLTGLISLQSKGLSRVFFNTIVQKHQFFGDQPSLWSNSNIQYKIKYVTASTCSPSIFHEVIGLDGMILVFECWVSSQLSQPPLSPSSRASLFPLQFLPTNWYHLHTWGCWYFSWQCWLQLVIHLAWHFTWCTLHRS